MTPPSHAFRLVAENELCRHATGFVQMGHNYRTIDWMIFSMDAETLKDVMKW